MDVAALLPALTPRAVEWAEAQSELVLGQGTPLDRAGLALASAVGVREPERIRLGVMPTVPFPDDPLLRAAAVEVGLMDPNTVGLTLGYAVVVVAGHESDLCLLAHEFRHVHQYELAGSIRAFLPPYLAEIVEFGYAAAPSEVDARNHECAASDAAFQSPS